MKTFFQDKKAFVALIFVLALIPILGLVGLASDYSFAVKAQSELNVAIDSAAIAASSEAANAVQGGATPEAAEAQGQALGAAWLNSQIPQRRAIRSAFPRCSATHSVCRFCNLSILQRRSRCSVGQPMCFSCSMSRNRC
jgi:hypothetical protein